MIASLDERQKSTQMRYLLDSIEKNKETEKEIEDARSGKRKMHFHHIEMDELKEQIVRFCIAGFDEAGNSSVMNRPVFTIELTKEELMEFIKKRMPEYSSAIKKEMEETIQWHRESIEYAERQLKELEKQNL